MRNCATKCAINGSRLNRIDSGNATGASEAGTAPPILRGPGPGLGGPVMGALAAKFTGVSGADAAAVPCGGAAGGGAVGFQDE